MVRKFNQLMGRHVLVTGLILGYGSLSSNLASSTIAVPTYMPLEIPCLSGWNDRTKKDSRVSIGSNLVKIDGMKSLFESFASGKNFNTNQQVMIGYLLPIIHFTSCLQSGTVLKKILDDNSAVISIETSLGNTPMHFAAANSSECLQLLIADGRLDVNEHNYNGETPLYVAMKYNKANVGPLLNCSQIKINSRDNRGRTMLHTAVIFGEADVVEQILALKGTPYGEGGQELDVDVKDDMGRTPADYLVAIGNINTRAKIQKLLHDAGAHNKDGVVVSEPTP
ncbi:MAG: ankyrin repeat domain-containing protein [Puniceicoccales bacterium]|jgi:ankyrin repeat protein|nr:ankyrin repeat domain-containing protein [Puniceicoccales bacterium]